MPDGAISAAPLGLDERDAAAGETVQRAGDFVQPLDADGFEIVAERGFDRAFPARLDFEGLAPRACCREAAARQPFRSACRHRD